MKTSSRLFNCRGCHEQVIVCSRCDTGQHYCSQECAKNARRLSCLEAGKRYQNTYQGKLNHAARQQRYRDRQAKNNEKVTHQSSPEVAQYDVLPIEPHEPKNAQNGLLTEGYCCHFCKRPVGHFLRRTFLGADRGKSSANRSFRSLFSKTT